MEQQLREEWHGFNKTHDWTDPETESADWWLSKIDSILKEKRGAIEKLKNKTKGKWDAETSKEDVYAQAIDDIIRIIESE